MAEFTNYLLKTGFFTKRRLVYRNSIQLNMQLLVSLLQVQNILTMTAILYTCPLTQEK